jgi:hypothetical protein
MQKYDKIFYNISVAFTFLVFAFIVFGLYVSFTKEEPILVPPMVNEIEKQLGQEVKPEYLDKFINIEGKG